MAQEKSIMRQMLEGGIPAPDERKNLTFPTAPEVPDDIDERAPVDLTILQMFLEEERFNKKQTQKIEDQKSFDDDWSNAQRISFLSTRSKEGRYPRIDDFVSDEKLGISASGLRVATATMKAVDGVYDGFTVSDSDLGKFGVGGLDARNALPLESTARTGLSAVYRTVGSGANLALRSLIGTYEGALAATDQTLAEFGMSSGDRQGVMLDMQLFLEHYAATMGARSLAPVRRELQVARRDARRAQAKAGKDNRQERAVSIKSDNINGEGAAVEDLANEQLQILLRDSKDKATKDLAFKELASRYMDEVENGHSIVPEASEVRAAANKVLDEGLPNLAHKQDAIDEAMKSFDEAVEATQDALGVVAPAEGVNPFIAGVSKEGTAIMGDILKKHGVRPMKSMTITEQFNELYQLGKIDGTTLVEYSKKFGMTGEEFLKSLGVNASEAGRTLAVYSHMARSMRAGARNVPGGEGVLEAWDTMGKAIHSNQRIRSLYNHMKRADNVRRGMMTSALTTTALNVLGSGGRLGLDAVTRSMDNTLRGMFGLPGEKNPLMGFDTIMRFAHPKKNIAMTDRILSGSPKHYDTLFNTYGSDIKIGGGSEVFWNNADKGVAMVNVLSRIQDRTIRSAAFISRLSRDLKKEGKDLYKMLDEDNFDAITFDMMQDALDEGMDMAFSKQFRKGVDHPTFDNVAANVIDAVRALPFVPVVGSGEYPFIRFMANSLDVFLQHQPTNMLKYIDKGQRAAFTAGDTSVFTKAASGGALYATAYTLHTTYNKGNHWYEYERDNGEILDIRQYQPFAAYAFFIDSVVRADEGRLRSSEFTTSDITEGIAGMRIRPESGLGKIDAAMGELAGIKDSETYIETLERWAGKRGSEITTPFRTIKQLMATFDDAENIIKSDAEQPFIANATKNIPIIGKDLPNYRSPVKAGDIRKTSVPLLQSFTGISYKDPKNLVEKQLSFHGFKSYKMGFKSRDKIFNQFVNGKMGEYVEDTVVPILETPAYKGSIPEMQRKMLMEHMAGARRVGVALAIKDAERGGEMLERLLVIRRSKMSAVDRDLYDALTRDQQVADAITHELNPD